VGPGPGPGSQGQVLDAADAQGCSGAAHASQVHARRAITVARSCQGNEHQGKQPRARWALPWDVPMLKSRRDDFGQQNLVDAGSSAPSGYLQRACSP